MINPNHGSWLALASTNQTNMLNAKKSLRKRVEEVARKVGENLNKELDDIADALFPRPQVKPARIPARR